MDLIIGKKIRDYNKEVSDSTIRSYVLNIKKILELLNIKDVKGLEIFYKDYKKVILKIKEEYSNSSHSQRNKMTACNALIKSLKDGKNDKKIDKALLEYIKEIKLLRNIIEDHLDTHEKTEKEEESWLTKTDIKLILKGLKDKVPEDIDSLDDLSKYRDYVIFLFYNSVPSRNDVAMAKFYYMDDIDIDDVKKDKLLNYIILDKDDKKVYYIMNNYKTVKKHSSQSLDLGNELYDVLRDYKEKMKVFNEEDWFLLSNKGKHISTNSLSIIYSKLGSVIGKKTSIRTNRHIKVSENIDMSKVKILARLMGHDVSIALNIYAKT